MLHGGLDPRQGISQCRDHHRSSMCCPNWWKGIGNGHSRVRLRSDTKQPRLCIGPSWRPGQCCCWRSICGPRHVRSPQVHYASLQRRESVRAATQCMGDYEHKHLCKELVHATCWSKFAGRISFHLACEGAKAPTRLHVPRCCGQDGLVTPSVPDPKDDLSSADHVASLRTQLHPVVHLHHALWTRVLAVSGKARRNKDPSYQACRVSQVEESSTDPIAPDRNLQRRKWPRIAPKQPHLMNCAALLARVGASTSHTVGDGYSKWRSLQACGSKSKKDQLTDPVSAQEVHYLKELSRGGAAQAEVQAPWDCHLRILWILISIHGLEGGESLYQISLTGQVKMEVIQRSVSARTVFLACHMRAMREARLVHPAGVEVCLGNQVLQRSVSWILTWRKGVGLSWFVYCKSPSRNLTISVSSVACPDECDDDWTGRPAVARTAWGPYQWMMVRSKNTKFKGKVRNDLRFHERPIDLGSAHQSNVDSSGVCLMLERRLQSISTVQCGQLKRLDQLRESLVIPLSSLIISRILSVHLMGYGI